MLRQLRLFSTLRLTHNNSPRCLLCGCKVKPTPALSIQARQQHGTLKINPRIDTSRRGSVDINQDFERDLKINDQSEKLVQKLKGVHVGFLGGGKMAKNLAKGNFLYATLVIE